MISVSRPKEAAQLTGRVADVMAEILATSTEHSSLAAEAASASDPSHTSRCTFSPLPGTARTSS